ncbi:hypothetical protein [Methanolobus profundi]|uniref:Glycine betaine/proline transport system substrate-binding protein n=1 Tax=Methanolobus profundi TaxID=487685 RepID=A0A1I4RAF6_9EURY|nr:hypothetical protein [Methanolobus profundi]SFM49284.1 glycine betaine/proline transport system substrate-binding protein [Methanolobus profundi]
MEIDIKRGYEVLPNNNVVFGIRITNNTELVISDVQVILDHNESLFKLQGETVQKLDSIPPKVPRTARFVLKPLGCVHKENIEATITYRNHKWEKRIVTMQPKHVHCVCPFLRPKAMEKNEFLHLSENGDSIESGINFQGVSSEDVTSFLMQTCATRLYVVESYSIGQDQILYFSGESVGEKNYYLLTALIKENNGTIRVMLRATSNKKHGINGFINEIIAELRHLVDTVNSSREIGIIKHEQVINIIDSVVQRSHISTGNEGASINVKDSVVQRRSHNAPIHEPLNNNAIPARKIDNSNENENSQEAEISNMYNAYLEEVEAKRRSNTNKK